MSDGITASCVFIGTTVAMIGGTILALPLADLYESRRVMLRVIGCILIFTGWIWCPWIAYGVYKLAMVTVNGINYCERAPEVTPKDPVRIDLNKPEPAQ